MQASMLLHEPFQALMRTRRRQKNEVFVAPASSFYTGGGFRVRITKQPDTREFEPFSVSRLEVGQVYEIGQRLAEFLIVAGYAEPDASPMAEAADRSRKRKAR